jgi:hypothetical protein
MSFRRNGFLHRWLMIVFAIAAFEGAAYAQFTVNITGPGYASTSAPSGSFTVSATVSGNANSIAKVVFYRNDVPYLTDTTSLYQLPQDQLGQDTYTYRARAYDSTGVWVDSSDVKLSVTTYQVKKMGQTIGGTPTTGPSRTQDHTAQIQAAVTWLGNNGGGTLLFPCKFDNDQISVYNIKNTIDVPGNVTLQGESAEQGFGRCRIYWIDAANQGAGCANNPGTLLNKPMFRVKGGNSRVRFKDLWLWSLSAGIECWPRSDFEQIAGENTNAIELNNKDYSGNIKDVIVENVCIESFTYGIKAISNNSAENEISDIKIRAYRAMGNHRQLFIDAKYAYNWDVQNVNAFLHQTQGAVEIVNAGRPASPTGENTKLKFLQVNCAGNRAFPPAFCAQVEKHGGLYFRQLHHEGVNEAIIVKDISGSTTTATTNPDPIVFESGVATGTFKDASMKLYLIGNAAFAAPEIANPGQDAGRLRFIQGGLNSTVVDCGDIHWDVTDTNPSHQSTPAPTPSWEDLGMYQTHAERNRPSFFAEDGSGNKFFKAHTICPQGVSGLSNINEVGGEYFDSGVMPTEAGTYSNELNSTTCPSPCTDASGALEDLFDLGGTVYINGAFTLQHTVTIPPGAQIVGTAGTSQLTLSGSDTNLFLINAPTAASDLPRASGIVIRDLKLITSGSGKTGIAIVGGTGAVGAASDLHFSGLTIEGFAIGLDVRPTVISPMGAQPMVDGISLKNNTFIDNQTAVRSLSANASNWNVMNLKMTSSSANAIGWDQRGGGHESLQNVICQGSPSNSMSDCIKLSNTGNYLAGLKQTNHVTNALTIWESILTNLVVRDSDFRLSLTTQSKVNLLGRAFIVSMNNKYDNFNVQSPYSTDYLWRGDYSRLTYCGDTYSGGVYTGSSNGLATRHPNLIVGAPTLTRVPCGARPIPWDDAIRLGGTSVDKPLVGNFFDDVREDFVIYREGTTSVPQSQFLIKQAGGIGNWTISWGLKDDLPMVGRFYPGTRAQIVIWRPSTGDFWAYNPNTNTYTSWHWGQTGDIPFVGNFLDESGSVSGNKDEVAVYRPGNKTFYIYNPRSGGWTGFATSPDNDSKIQVGDFLGVGYDQIAQYKAGVWNIINPRTLSTYTVNLGQTGDIPVAGKYLSGACTQVAVWRPTVQPGSGEPDHSEFLVADPFTSCGTRTPTLIWGSNNEFNSTAQYVDDIPLTINTADGTLRRPTAYRPTTGAFPYSISNGQWWVHDPF